MSFVRAKTGKEYPCSGRGRELCPRTEQVFLDRSTVPRCTDELGAKKTLTVLDFKDAAISRLEIDN